MSIATVHSLPPDSRRLKIAYLYHIPIEGKPLEPSEWIRLRSFTTRLVADLGMSKNLHAKYFIQMSRLQNLPWRDELHRHSKFWSVKTGLAVRPNRPLPGPLSLKDILSLKAPVMPEVVLQIGKDENIHHFAPEQEIPSVIDVYLGCGGTAIFLIADPEKFLSQAKELFAAKLDPALAGFDFCAPILNLRDFTSASADTLQGWFSAFDVYIAEIQDDPGILIAAREPLDQVLAGLQHLLDGKAYEHR